MAVLRTHRILAGVPSQGEGASLSDDHDRYSLKVGHVEHRPSGFLVAHAHEELFTYIDNPTNEPQVLVTWEVNPDDVLKKKNADELVISKGKVVRVKVLRSEPEDQKEALKRGRLLSVLCERLSFDQLFGVSEPKRILRSKTVRGPALDLEAIQDALRYYFNFKSYPSTTGLRHKGYIQFFKPQGIISPDDKRPLEKVPCMVDCSCPDYRYRWAWTNKQRDSGRVGPDSLNGAFNQAPRKTNPTGAAGLCKHLLALRDFIYGQTSNFSGDSVDTSRLDKLTKWAGKRWINMSTEMAKAKAREKSYRDLAQARRSGEVPPEDDTPSPDEGPLRDVVPDDLPPESPDPLAPPDDPTEPPPATVPLPPDRGPVPRTRLSKSAVPIPPEIGEEPKPDLPAEPVAGQPAPSFFQRMTGKIKRAAKKNVRPRRPRTESLRTLRTSRVITTMKELTDAHKLVEEMEVDAPAADQGEEALQLLRDIKDQLVILNGGDEEGDDDDGIPDEDTDDEPEDDDAGLGDDDDRLATPEAPAAPMA